MTRQSTEETTANTAVLLRRALAVIDAVVPQRLAERGHSAIRTAHGPVFQNLDSGGTTVSVLAQRAGMTKQAMAELVQYLEGHGYVRRTPNPNDARAKLVQLTDTGRDVVAVVQELVPQMERQLLQALGTSRWREMRVDLVRIREIFDPATPSK
jgi:DNA-binding MarR family transcriptional regulator